MNEKITEKVKLKDISDNKKNNYEFLKNSQIYNNDQKKIKPQTIKQ